MRQQRYLEAIAEHERVLAMDPGHLTSYYNLTTTFLEQGDFERAQELIDRGREIAPNISRNRNPGGKVYSCNSNG